MTCGHSRLYVTDSTMRQNEITPCLWCRLAKYEAQGGPQKIAEPPKPYFPGTASMFASQHKLVMTTEWMRGWNACLDEIDRNGGFTRDAGGDHG